MTSGGNPTFGAQQLSHRPGRLRPVARRGRWIAGGLALQLVGVGAPVDYVYSKAKHLGVGDALTFATFKLAWHNSLHTRAGAVTLAVGLVLFAIGSVLLARPFTKNIVTLVVVVPLAAMGGAFILGVVALVIALLIVILDNGFDGFDGVGGADLGGSSRRREDEPASEPARNRPRVIELKPVAPEAEKPEDRELRP
ncbi:hypothetical protein [Actinospica robiniae]|uniref:hypothetical protein n=1 Tax=Actinospica robiniae TaxID=304901 RepID=UPI00042037D7|nr:hypothetical protein [Actinospica robiniae]